MTNKLLFIVGSCAVVASAGVSAPAIAKERPVVVTAQPENQASIRRISYADLNLASADGKTILNRRVRGAVKDVCSDASGPSPLLLVTQQCHKSAWAGAKPQMDAAFQRAAEIAQTGHSSIPLMAIRIAVAAR